MKNKKQNLPKTEALTFADILTILQQQGRPMEFSALADALESFPPTAVQACLKKMEKMGSIARNRRGAYLVPQKADLIAGRILGKAQGHGYLLRDDNEENVYLSPHEMSKAFHGDRVWIRLGKKDLRGRQEGVIVEVIQYGQSQLVGRIRKEQGAFFLQPEDRRIVHEILIEKPEKKMAALIKDGQWVSVFLTRRPAPGQHAVGKIVDILNHSEEDLLVEIAQRKHQLPTEFSPECLEESAAFPDAVVASDLVGREDFRHLPFVTIDGEDAKDFDDALWSTPEKDGYRLMVAIADVSHYVRVGSALEREAAERGTSVYFPNRVIPMLPEKLSNGLCSLNPRVDRLVLVCEMNVSAKGEVMHWRFMRGVIHSQARLTYTEVAKAMSGHSTLPAAVPLSALTGVFHCLAHAREKRGAMELDTVETKIAFDSHGRVEELVRIERNEAHRLVEECMLAANTCAAIELTNHNYSFLFRIHEPPSEEKLLRLREFLTACGLQLAGGDKPSPQDFAKLATEVRVRPDSLVIQTMMLRTMQQARYSPNNLGHFGLAYQSYTHFTSPIRRYPDLTVHRQLHHLLRHELPSHEVAWTTVGQHCSMTERRADEATREVNARLNCLYMQRHVGEIFSASISGVTSFGVFVTLTALQVDGLVHISDLGNDYYHFHEGRQQLVGERGGAVFRLGQPLRVRLVRADVMSGKIDFVLAPPL